MLRRYTKVCTLEKTPGYVVDRVAQSIECAICFTLALLLLERLLPAVMVKSPHLARTTAPTVRRIVE